MSEHGDDGDDDESISARNWMEAVARAVGSR